MKGPTHKGASVEGKTRNGKGGNTYRWPAVWGEHWLTAEVGKLGVQRFIGERG